MRRTLWTAGIIVVAELLLLARVWAHAGMLGLMLLLIGSAAVGLLVLKQHGGAALASWAGPAPTNAADEARVWQIRLGLVAGLLLIVPGVLSTIAGALLLLPPVRSLVASKVRTRVPSGMPARMVMSWGARFGAKVREKADAKMGDQAREARRGPIIDVDAAPKGNNGDPNRPPRNKRLN